jgi:hypothetical protein
MIRPNISTLARPKHIQQVSIKRRSVPKAIPIDVTYFTGKTIILFTMFYCSLQWAQYRFLREQQENDANDNDKK